MPRYVLASVGVTVLLLALSAQQTPETGVHKEATNCPAMDGKPDCAEANNTQDQIQCLGTVLSEVDARVESKYKQVVAIWDSKNDPKGKQDFEASQKTWISYRGQSCDNIWAFWNPGTIKNPAALHCQIELGRQRICALQHMYEIPLRQR